MEHFAGSDYPIVHHTPIPQEDMGENRGDLSPEDLEAMREVKALTGRLPRMFALVRWPDGEDEEAGRSSEIVAYGLELPCGEAATIGVARGFGRWRSARSAALRLRSDLVWLGGKSA